MNVFKWSGSLLIFCVMCSFQALAQGPVFSNSHYVYSTKTAPLTASVTPANTTSSNPISTTFAMDVMMPPELSVPQRKINNAMLFVKVNLGDDYKYGPNSTTEDSPLDFKYRVSFSLTGYNASATVPGVFEQSAYELTIENGKPEALYVKNLTRFSDIQKNTVTASDLTFQRATISSVTITPLITATSAPSIQASMLATIANSIRFEISYDIEYGIHAGTALAKPVLTPLGSTKQVGKQITFQWSANGYQFPNYELQLLRLFNNSNSTASSEKQITADIDWSKALKIETQSSNTSLTLTVAEGTGFYVWRVRPLGTYYDGGIANSQNYSESNWSLNPGNANGVSLQFVDATGLSYSGADASAYFYYEDIAADKNWIYSRVFTEENKVFENITYATPLLQARQTQAYRASKNKTVVTQTITDNSGRPALSTMGVPVSGKVGDYKKAFVQKEGTTALYSVKDFDQASNYKTPSRVNQNQTPLSYYSDQNPDVNIPSAEGYPFQRTLFYNDGSQRVQEQSGVGKTHMIGNNQNGSGAGKTVRTLYGTASETELVSLFGDEAPSHETVLKTVNIDQNNTASISYTSKEGNVIATCLSFQDGDEDNALDPLNGEGAASASQPVRDRIHKSVLTEKGFMSSKRIALMQATPMNITYKVKCQELENSCLDLQLDCKYTVTVIIHNVENPSATVVLPPISLNATACTPDADGVDYKSVSWPQQTLSPGTYVIEKKLEAGNPEIEVESKAKAESQVMPLISKITGWLDGITCETQLQQFYVNLNAIRDDINNAYAPGTTCDAACVVARYQLGNFTLTNEHHIDITTNTSGKPERLLLTSPCCGTMSVSVAYIPPFRCPTTAGQVEVAGTATSGTDVNFNFFEDPGKTEYFPDFEGYAWGLLKDCQSPTFTLNIFYNKYMIGWKNPGDFNKMIYHMLTDKYNAVGVEPVAGTTNANPSPPKPSKDDCGVAVEGTGIFCDPGTNNCTQYTCAQLIDCWTQQVILLRNSICGDAEYDDENGTNVSSRTDKNLGEPEGSGKTHNDTFDDNFNDVKLSRRKKRKLKKKISQTMRDLSAARPAGEYTGFLVKDFLDCTGYKFVKILTAEDPAPLQADVKNALRYNVPFVAGATTGTVVACPAGGCKKWPYAPPTLTGGVAWQDVVVVPANAGVPAKTMKDYFPHVRDPLYAFKYFEYPEANRMRDVELLTCYSDPNDCYKTDLSGNVIMSGGRPVKIPCCFVKNTDGTYSQGPLCEDNPVTVANGTGNYSTNNNSTYDKRYYVKSFCDKGKVVCPYNADGWSAGQRYTFYQMLATYIPPSAEDRQGDGDEVLESPSDYTDVPMGLYNDPNNIIGMTTDDVADWRTWNNLGPNDPFTTPTVVQFEMTKMAQTCLGKCDSRRKEFRDKLVLAFTKGGYIIGGCKSSASDNVVIEEDIDLLVDEIVSKCKLQCPITTYKIETAYCRTINKEITFVGPTNSNVEIEYGVGGCAGGCPGNVANCQDNTCDPSTGACPPNNVLSRCEQKKWKQVMQWNFEIDMPSMLDLDNNGTPDGGRKFNCVSNPNMADYTLFPSALDGGVPDINNFKTAKTVSPAVEINVSLPAKN